MKPYSEAGIERRAFLQRSGALIMTSAVAPHMQTASAQEHGADAITVGLVTDLHYADKKTSGTRHFRESIDKPRRANVSRMLSLTFW